MSATVSMVKELGGLNESSDYLLFRFTAQDELDAAITRMIAVSQAWIRRRAPELYTTTDADTILLRDQGEAWITLDFLTMPLKSRKIFGTHWALDQEDSSRFQELIEVEYKARAQDVLGLDLTVINAPDAFARPVFRVGRGVDLVNDPTIDTEAEQVAATAERARSLTGVL